MFTFSAPYPAIQTTSLLPNPQLGDAENLDDTLNIIRSMNNTPYSYVKLKNRQKSIWQFRLSKNKALELLEFYRAYSGHSIKVIDHKDRIWIGNITNNPFEISCDRVGRPVIQGWGSADWVGVSVEFEGILQ